MTAKLIVGAVLLFAAASIQAAEPLNRGVYFGGSFGSSLFDDDGAFFGLNFDDTDRSWQVNAGYKFLRYFAVEGRYTDYGTFGLDSVSFDVSGFSAHAVGIVPFGNSGWELFGQLGLGRLKVDVLDNDEEQSTFAGGIGVRYYPTENLSVGLQTDVHVWEETSPFGPSLEPSVGATQVQVQLTF